MTTIASATTALATLAFRCVDLVDREDVEELQEMVDRSKDIDFATFSQHVDWRPLAAQMGYAIEPGAPGMLLEKDWAVSFSKSTWRGEPVHIMVHSAIEFVFRIQPDSKKILPSDPWGGREEVDTQPQTSVKRQARKARP